MELSLNATVNKLVELLTLEKSRLLSGALSDLAEITEHKQHYLAELASHLESHQENASLRAFTPHIEQIRKLAVENENLIEAAKSGVNAAQSRLKQVMSRESFVGAYTEDGGKLRAHDAGVTRRKFA